MKLQPWTHSNGVQRRLLRPSVLDLLQPAHIPRISSPLARLYHPLEALRDADVDIFRQQYFALEQPVLLPRSQFRDLPAVKHWFERSSSPPTATGRSATRLNVEYLQTHGADAFVPLELTELSAHNASSNGDGSHQSAASDVVSFRQFHAPLTLFLEWMRMAETSPQSTRLYLAQCQLLDLPQVLRDDFPTPEIVLMAGKGDVYDTNVWIGHPPTYTPLHRDPNPNLFVQLAGQKVVRLLAPSEGQALFSSIRRQLGKSGGKEAAAIRGEEMMQGQERALLDDMVWGAASTGSEAGYEANLEAGDGLFIPKGWWHSIKGLGEGVTASVSAARVPRSTLAVADANHKVGQLVVPMKARIMTTVDMEFELYFNYQVHTPSMQLSRTAYRAALFHLSVNPILVRASIPTWSLSSTAQLPQTPTSRLYTILFPLCAPGGRALESIRQSHTMSSSQSDSAPPKQETNESQLQEGTQAQSPQEHLYLPEAESSSDGQPKQLRLDLGADGGVTLDHLGPMVVNVDGSLSRIGNWEQMTEIERKNTMRILGKRNKQRLEVLRAADEQK
ncbi:uncharacterized protein N7482_002279 [Penicillium canariense]|uniref:JmjC domain-containing protein n=1 Tax=Penicillium canariense TaxID=189055 RepID=A0A9W9LUZ8_9EURO|nr:uncharacterized protein N7482_002279 [Penicillium canariense]KAJ5176402.1 hypothetical protein N7482_002279 [Penicillium canariense]